MAKLNALLIEDDATDRALIAREFRLVEYLAFDLATASSLRSGIEELNRSQFDVVLLDLSLPDAHGLDALQVITGHWPDLAVVVLTGLDDQKTVISALQQGAQDYLPKDAFNGGLLLRSLQYAIERKRIASELQHSELQYRALVAAMTSIVWSTDAYGMIQDEQPAWSNYTGQSADESRGRGWQAAIHLDQRAEAAAFWETTSDHLRKLEFHRRVWHAASECHRRCFVRVVPITQPDGVVCEWVGTLTDVENAMQAEEALRRAERLAALGTLAAGIAHEINNPIVAAWSSAQAALNVMGNPKQSNMLEDCLQNVIHSVERCRDTVASVLRFARYGEVERCACNIRMVIRRAIEEVTHFADSHEQSVVWDDDSELSLVYGNQTSDTASPRDGTEERVRGWSSWIGRLCNC